MTKHLKYIFLIFSILYPIQNFANVISQDTQNFNPTTSGIDFVTVQSSETLDPGYYNLGLFFNYAVNTLPYFENAEETQSFTKHNDALLMMDMNVGFGVFRNFELGVSFPRLVSQYIKSEAARGQFGSNGSTEIRFMGKYRLLGNDNGGVAMAYTINVNRISNNPYHGTKSAPIHNLELIGDTTIGKVALGANLGYRLRDPGEPLTGSSIKPIEDQVIASVAASYLLTAIDTKLISEIFASIPASKTESVASNRSSTSAEWLIGLKHDVTRNLAMHFGGGTELISGAASPDWRLYLGVNFSDNIHQYRREKVKKEKPNSKDKVAKKKDKPKQKSPGKIRTPVAPAIVKSDDPLDQPPVPGKSVIVLDDVQFEFDSYENLLPGAMETIDKLVEYLRRPPAFKSVRVEGHTDSVGSDQYNMLLSFRRAWKIRSILIEKYGLIPTYIDAKGFGEERPIADNGNYQGRQENRRVEFHIER